MTLTAGTCLGHFEIVSPLGAGGMGEVYLARDRKLRRQVAVKVLHENRSGDPSARRRFEQEARAVAALAHPNILAIHYFDTHDDVHYAVTELLEGETLRELVTRSPLAWPLAVRIGAAIAEGLAAAHEKGIIHRDLKPANVFLTTQGEVKILDFGLAHMSNDLTATPEGSTELMTAPNSIMGTVGYMSPEQLSGHAVDETTDIFALGCVLHEMIGGRHPFVRATATATMAAVLRDDPPELPAGTVPPPLSELIRRCLEKDPRARPQNARAIAAELRKLPAESQTVITPEATPAISRRAPMLIASLLTLGFLAAGALVLSLRETRPDSRESQLTPRNARSILVVPFENASRDSGAEYLSDGIAEGLINTLAKLPDVRIVARTTAFQYKGKTLDLPRIGRELDVDAVLSGRLVSHANNLTVQADLVSTRGGHALWGHRFHQQNGDVLRIEQEIVSQISEALRFQLEPSQQRRVSRPPTRNAEAYKLYLQGRFYWNKRNREAITRAIELFEQAIALDPQFALAYTGVADAYHMLGNSYDLHLMGVGRARSRHAVETALRLDPELAEAHTSLGLIEANEYRWARAANAFERALELNPNHANALLWYSLVFLGRNQLDESLAMVRRAEQVDPLSPVIISNIAQRLNMQGNHAAALEYAKKAHEVQPGYMEVYLQTGLAYEGLGQKEHAAATYRKGAGLDGLQGLREQYLVRAAVMSGDLNEARRLVRLMDDRARRREIVYVQVGFAYAAIGDRDKAIEWLNLAFEAREPGLRNSIRSPAVKELRGDPRFEELLLRLERGRGD
jgi:eukaryotic-like serine/threonine-protein kinase